MSNKLGGELLLNIMRMHMDCPITDDVCPHVKQRIVTIDAVKTQITFVQYARNDSLFFQNLIFM